MVFMASAVDCAAALTLSQRLIKLAFFKDDGATPLGTPSK